MLAMGSCVPSYGEMAKPVLFWSVPNPEQWVPGDEPAYLVVTEKNWFNYYSSPPTGSDFAAYIYLVASLGVKPNPGYKIAIVEVKQLKDKVTVKLELKEPDPRKVYPQVIVRPVAVAKVAKAGLEPRGILDFVFIDKEGRQLAILRAEV